MNAQAGSQIIEPELRDIIRLQWSEETLEEPLSTGSDFILNTVLYRATYS